MASASRAGWRERLGLAAIGALFLAHAWWLGGVTEDAYILFRYAEHLVAGHGLVWNIGEAPIEGYTTFLWMLVCAAALALGLPAQTATLVLGVALGLVGLGACHRFARDVFGLRGTFALLPPALLAAAGPWAAWSASGMETVAFASFSLLAALDTARSLGTRPPLLPGPELRKDGTGLALERAALWCLLASLTRPEGVLVSVSLGALAFGFGLRRVGGLPRAARAAALYAVPGALYFAWRVWYFGDWLPNTFHAKTTGTLSQVERGFAYLGYFARCFLLPLAWTPLAAAWARRERTRAGGALRPWPVAGLAVCAAVAGPLALAVGLLGGDYMAMTRFAVPLLPFATLVAGLLAHTAWEALAGRWAGRGVIALGLAASLAGLAVQSTPLEARLYDEPAFGFGTWRGLQKERWQVARLRTIGRFFARYGEPGESLATRSIGAIGYLSGLAVHDMHGLTDRHVARTGAAGAGGGFAGHEKQDLAYTLSRRPTFVVLSRHLVKRPRTLDELPAGLRSLVEDEYVLRYERLVDEENSESGWFGFLERRDRKPSTRSFRSQPPAASPGSAEFAEEGEPVRGEEAP